MDILSLLSNSQNNTNSSQESSTVSQNVSNSPEGISQYLMLSMLLTPAAVSSDSEKKLAMSDQKNDLNQQDNNVQADAMNPNAADSALLLAQMNFMLGANKNDIATKPENTDLQQSDLVDQSQDATMKNMTSALMMKVGTINANSDNKTTDAKILSENVVAPSLEVPPKSILQQLPTLTENTVAQLPEDASEKISQSLPNLSEKFPELTSQQLSEKLSDMLHKQKLSYSEDVSIQSKQMIKDNNVSLQIDVSAVEKTSTINIPIKESEAQPNKYVDVLTQVANTINFHTANHLPIPHQETISDVALGRAEFVEAMKKAQTPAPEMTIELLPQSIDAMVKEAYDAKIKIYPPELGQVQAKLRVSKNNAELVIMTENSQVKGIVEANLPQLRQHFQQADINLTNVHVEVFQSTTKEQNNQNRQQDDQRQGRYNTNELNEEVNQPIEAKKIITSIIDTYA